MSGNRPTRPGKRENSLRMMQPSRDMAGGRGALGTEAKFGMLHNRRAPAAAACLEDESDFEGHLVL